MEHRRGHSIEYPKAKKPAADTNFRGHRVVSSAVSDVERHLASMYRPLDPTTTSSVKFRVGSPPLRSLPLLTDQSPPWTGVPFLDALEDDIEKEVEGILRSYDIKNPYSDDETVRDYSVQLVNRIKPNDPGSKMPTVLIVAKWEKDSPSTWPKAVADIRTHVDGLARISMGRPEISVEMIARELNDWKYLGPVLNNPRLERDWPSLKTSTYSILKNLDMGSEITAISLFRLGYNEDTETNPVTLYISMSEESDESKWPLAIEAIHTKLMRLGWSNIVVHIEHNEVEQYPFKLRTPSKDGPSQGTDLIILLDYQQRVNLGDDISVAKYILRTDGKEMNSIMGTLGCYLEIKTQTNTNWTTFGLTNHHVIRPSLQGFGFEGHGDVTRIATPGPGTFLAQKDLKGVWPSDSSTTPIESPSQVKHNATVHANRTLLQRFSPEDRRDVKGPSFALERGMNKKIKFFDDNHNIFARVWASSGFARRTSTNGRLDWALLEVRPLRMGQNTLPKLEDWLPGSASSETPNPSTFGKPLRPQGAVTLKTMTAGTFLYKSGAATKTRVGKFSKFQTSTFTIKEDSYMGLPKSSEFVVIGTDQRKEAGFADSGDSGAVVYDEDGQVVGLLFRGQKPQQSVGGYTFVTPIEDVLHDIKEFSKGGIVDIRIAKP